MLIPAPLTPMTHACKRLGLRFWAMRVNAPATPETEFEVYSQEEAQSSAAPPEALPATKSFKGLKISLASVENGVDSYADSPLYKKLPMRSPSEKWVHAFVRVDGEAQTAREWEPKGIRFVDSSGLVFDPRPFDNVRHKAEGTEMSFFGSLWKHEPAYDVEVEMGKTAAASFSKDELRTVVLPVPPRNSSPVGFNNPTGFSLGARRVDVSDPYWGSSGPPILVIPFSIRRQPDPGPRIVLIGVTDNEGRVVPRGENWDRDTYIHFPQKGVEMTHARMSVRITKPAHTIKVTFALAEPDWVRFRVKPTQWMPPK